MKVLVGIIVVIVLVVVLAVLKPSLERMDRDEQLLATVAAGRECSLQLIGSNGMIRQITCEDGDVQEFVWDGQTGDLVRTR